MSEWVKLLSEYASKILKASQSYDDLA
jgi:hypothetical protein